MLFVYKLVCVLSRLQILFPLQLRVALDQRTENRVMTMSSHTDENVRHVRDLTWSVVICPFAHGLK